MWVPAGLVYFHVAVFLFMAWLQMKVKGGKPEKWLCYKSWVAKYDRHRTTTDSSGFTYPQLTQT
jgi:hypothetical protein